MATSSKVVADGVLEMQRHAAAGERSPDDLQVRIQEHTERIRKYEYRTRHKIPTSAPYNGELTHPISVANLLATALAQAGQPLSKAQVAEFERLGLSFDEEFRKLRDGWRPDVPRARRMLEEFRLKKTFSESLWAVLTPEQRPTWVDPAWRGVAGIDLFDPTLMVLHTTTVVTGTNAAQIREKLLPIVRSRAGLAADAASTAADRAVDAFVDRTTRGLQPVPAVKARYYSADDALVAGEASADLVDALLRDVATTQAAKDALLDDGRWVLPRLTS